MQVSAWKNCKNSEIGQTYGIRVGIRNRNQYFDTNWREIKVEIDSSSYTFLLTNGFWKQCPEFCDRGNLPVIRNWLQKYKTLQWKENKPPKVKLVSLGSGRFRLLP